jgi:hypothetical protein
MLYRVYEHSNCRSLMLLMGCHIKPLVVRVPHHTQNHNPKSSSRTARCGHAACSAQALVGVHTTEQRATLHLDPHEGAYSFLRWHVPLILTTATKKKTGCAWCVWQPTATKNTKPE